MVLLCSLGAGALLSASAQVARPVDRRLPSLSNTFPPSNVLVDGENVIAYDRSSRQIFQLAAQTEAMAAKPVFSLSARSTGNSGSEEGTSVWDLDARKDKAGNIIVSWRDEVGATRAGRTDSIQLLYLIPGGKVEHYVVKRFPEFRSFFDLRMFVADSKSIHFFYTYYSETHAGLAPDANSIEKLWMLHWRDRKVRFDNQLSEKGTYHATRFDASDAGNGRFDLAWIEQRIGSPLGAGKQLKIGHVTTDADRPRLRESGSVAIDAWEANERTVFPLVTRSVGGELEALARIPQGRSGALLKKIDARGKVLGDIKVDGAEVTEFGYNPKTGLFRYVKGRLILLKQPEVVEAELHWTDFKGRGWTEKLEMPVDSILLKQFPGDCFYWLRVKETRFELHKKCRPGA